MSLQSNDEKADLGFNQPRPDILSFCCCASRYNRKVILITLGEKCMLDEQVSPLCLAHHDLICDASSALEFSLDDFLCRSSDIMCGAHGWICRCNDRHQVKTVGFVDLYFLSMYCP